MQRLLNQAHSSLIKNKKTLAVAESCSGGLLSKLLTDFAGSSKYFLLGLVAYSNKAKEKSLKIPAALIRKKGAVSLETASLMAQNIRKIAASDFGLAITGIAGPQGGSLRKPVGTVFIAAASKNRLICRRYIFSGKRAVVRRKAALGALKLLNRLY
jgi:nicotinamide-nucleotide amidase